MEKQDVRYLKRLFLLKESSLTVPTVLHQPPAHLVQLNWYRQCYSLLFFFSDALGQNIQIQKHYTNVEELIIPQRT